MTRRLPTRDNKQFDHHAKLQALMVPPASPTETTFRHSHWQARRARIRQALCTCGMRDLGLNRWDECGSQCTVEYSPSLARFRLRANYCKCRFCEPCMRSKANRIAANLRDKLSLDVGQKNRFVTLTLAHSDTPLREQINRLYKSFKKLRGLPLWKASQVGGAFMLEVKRSKTGWHPHLHIITQGNFIAQAELSNAWHRITGDSFIVDVQLIKEDRATAHYVTKYITKACNAEVWNDPSHAQEFVLAMKGIRTCATFGSWRKLRLTAVTETADDWQPLCSLDKLFAAVTAKDPQALQILHELIKAKPVEAQG